MIGNYDSKIQSQLVCEYKSVSPFAVTQKVEFISTLNLIIAPRPLSHHYPYIRSPVCLCNFCLCFYYYFENKKQQKTKTTKKQKQKQRKPRTAEEAEGSFIRGNREK